MSNLNEDDDIDELLDDLLSDVDHSDEEENINIRFEQEEPDDAHESDSIAEDYNDFDEESVMDGPDDPLECNRQLLNFWLQLKEHTAALLQKVECKLAEIETRMKSKYLSNKQVLFYTPGIPYFKDRNHFSPFPNEDTMLKKARGEIHIDMLPKVCPWTASDRCILLKSIKQEAITTVLQSQENVNPDNCITRSMSPKKSSSEHKKSNSCLPSDFKDMVGPLGARDFDWSHIANTCFHNKHSALDCSVMWNVFLHPDINKAGWKKSEDMKLREIVQKNKYQNWDKICRELGTNRSAYQCFIRYNSTKKVPEVRNCVWPPDEDNKLCRLVKAFQIGDCIQWREIATFMDDRTKQQVYFRWTYSLAPDLVKGRFTSEENKLLIEGVKKYGPNFRKISIDLMPNRSAVQLNDRYQRLQPDGVKQQNIWTKQQDNQLLMLHKEYGAKWSQIAQYFVGKTRTQLRHRHTALKKLLKKSALKAQRSAASKKHQDTQNAMELEEQNSKDIINETHTDEVDMKLIEYFRSRNSATMNERPRETYDTEELNNHTQYLYNVLRLLDANLDIPDNLDNWPLSNRQKHLLSSLKQYNRLRNDKERQNKIIEECAKHMFTSVPSSQNNIESTSTNSQSGRKRKKKPKDPCIIDYDLNKNGAFVVSTAEELETPDCVKNVIKEDNTTFIKLCRLLDSTCSSNSQQYLNNKLPRPFPTIRDTPNVIVNKNPEVQGNFIPNMFTASSIYNEQSFTLVSHVDKFSESTNEPTAIEPTFESLQALKNLLYMKNLSKWATENCERRNLDDDEIADDDTANNLKSTQSSEEYNKAYSLLERRITQLFKYPLGLSRTDLPNVSNTCM